MNFDVDLQISPVSMDVVMGQVQQFDAHMGEIYREAAKPEIFWCEYGVTTHDEVSAAVAKNMLPIVQYGGRYLIYSQTDSSGRHIFSCLSNEYSNRAILTTANHWDFGTIVLETQVFKVQQLTDKTSANAYPSGKCVYDFVTGYLPTAMFTKDDIINLNPSVEINGLSGIKIGKLAMFNVYFKATEDIPAWTILWNHPTGCVPAADVISMIGSDAFSYENAGVKNNKALNKDWWYRFQIIYITR